MGEREGISQCGAPGTSDPSPLAVEPVAEPTHAPPPRWRLLFSVTTRGFYHSSRLLDGRAQAVLPASARQWREGVVWLVLHDQAERPR